MRAATWIFVLVLAAGCSSGHRTAEPTTTPTTRGESPSSHAGARASSKAAATPAVKEEKKAKARKHAKPQRRRRALPWRADGISQVVHVKVKRVAVYARPGAKRALLVLRKRDERGTQRAFLVRRASKKWLRVYLPTRPNGSQGWIRARAVKKYTNGYRIVVRLGAHKLFVWRGTKRIATYPVAVGTSSTPTPRGLFYVVELLKPNKPNGSYGPFAFGLSAHSNQLKRFAGGDGRVGLHGTNQPWLIGSSVSHGCIRLKNPAIRRLAHILPLGTPVYIRA
jgi:lipoprotein-anchoring transpeptidase ErfK/SrfK